jgi:phosphoglycolate phosphatase
MNLVLALFDIDGTILDTQGAGRRAFVRALRHTFGWDDPLDYVTFSGGTDVAILSKVMAHHGLADPGGALSRRFFGRLPVELEAATAAQEYRLHHGVRELLDDLAGRGDVLLGLVTGNVEACAWIKLRCFGLDHRFAFGGFGEDHADRDEIARAALARAESRLQPGQRFARRVLVGDTPHDVAAARAVGAVSVAVATGKHRREDLDAAGADIVVSTLADPAARAAFRPPPPGVAAP